MAIHGNILIVDDEPDMCWILENALIDRGYQVTAVNNASRAVAVTENSKYDIVLIDAKLPDADGLQIAQQFLTKYPEMKLVVMSGFYSMREDLKDTEVDYKKVEFLGKPFDFQDIYQMLDELI